MARDALSILLRVRSGAVVAASRDLAAARSIERQHVSALDIHQEAIRHEQAQMCGEHIAAFVIWLSQARRRTDMLKDVIQTEQAKVAQLQRILVDRRTDAEAVVKIIERKALAAALVQTQRDQAVMDEAAGRAGRFSPGSPAC